MLHKVKCYVGAFTTRIEFGRSLCLVLSYTGRDALRHLWQSTLLAAAVILATMLATVLAEWWQL